MNLSLICKRKRRPIELKNNKKTETTVDSKIYVDFVISFQLATCYFFLCDPNKILLDFPSETIVSIL